MRYDFSNVTLQTMIEEYKLLLRDYKSLIDQAKAPDGDGHIYEGPDCLLCGHFGPADEPEKCQGRVHYSTVVKENEALKLEVAKLKEDLYSIKNVAHFKPEARILELEKECERQREVILDYLANEYKAY